jgi:hypothetical protein
VEAYHTPHTKTTPFVKWCGFGVLKIFRGNTICAPFTHHILVVLCGITIILIPYLCFDDMAFAFIEQNRNKLFSIKNKNKCRNCVPTSAIMNNADFDNLEFTQGLDALTAGTQSESDDEEDEDENNNGGDVEEDEEENGVMENRTQVSNMSDLTNSQNSVQQTLSGKNKTKRRTSPVWTHFKELEIVKPGDYSPINVLFIFSNNY